MSGRHLSLRGWYAGLLLVWLPLTLLALLFWFGIGPLGPRPDPRPIVGTHYLPPIIWALLPIVTAPFGLTKKFVTE